MKMKIYNKQQDLWNRLKLAAIIIGVLYIVSMLISCSEEETHKVRYELDCRGICEGYYDTSDRMDSMIVTQDVWTHEFIADEDDLAYVNFMFRSGTVDKDSVILRIYIDNVLHYEEKQYIYLKRITALVSP